MKYLDLKSLVRLSGVCHHMSTICRDSIVWRALYVNTFKGNHLKVVDRVFVNFCAVVLFLINLNCFRR